MNSQITKLIPWIVTIAYALLFSYTTVDIPWYKVPNGLLWLVIVPVGLGIWIRKSE